MSSGTLLSLLRNWTLQPQSRRRSMPPNSWNVYPDLLTTEQRTYRRQQPHHSRSFLDCRCHDKCCPWPRRRLPNENLLVLSLIQILCGVAAVILSGVSISKDVSLAKIGTGVWTGAVMMATGSHGIVTARRKGPCTLITLLVLCVIAAITATLLTCLSTAGLIADSTVHPQASKAQLMMMHALLLIVGILESSVAVTTAILCCRQVCCGPVMTTSASAAHRQNNGAGGHTFMLSQDVYLPGGEHSLALRVPAPYLSSVGRSRGRESTSLLFIMPCPSTSSHVSPGGHPSSAPPAYATSFCFPPSSLASYVEPPPSYGSEPSTQRDPLPAPISPPPLDNNFCYIPGNPDHFTPAPSHQQTLPPAYPGH